MEDAAGVPIPHILWGWGLAENHLKGELETRELSSSRVPVAGGKEVLTHEPFPRDNKKKMDIGKIK